MMIKRTFLLFFLISLTEISYSQEDDFGIWLGVDARHQLSKKMEIELAGCIRTFNNTSQIEQSFLEGGLQYNFSKCISASGSYRLISKLEDDTKYYFRHKLFIDLKASLPYRNISFSGRLRMQRTTKTYIEDEEDLISKYYVRLRLKASYNSKSSPLTPYSYVETFFPLFSDAGFKINKYRLCGGVEIRITRGFSLETEYIFQRDYQPHIANRHIMAINLKSKF